MKKRKIFTQYKYRVVIQGGVHTRQAAERFVWADGPQEGAIAALSLSPGGIYHVSVENPVSGQIILFQGNRTDNEISVLLVGQS